MKTNNLSETFKVYQGRRVLVTGHTGFKGAWLSLWLHKLGAKVYGYALAPPTKPSLYQLCTLDAIVDSTRADIRDCKRLQETLKEKKPEIVFHLAAQPLVRDSYVDPVGTFEMNVMGTVHLLEAVRHCPSVKAVVNITTDKCYENKEWLWPYRENEPLGGFDPYSSSKACSELVTAAYRNSFFNPHTIEKLGVALASARAGNVIGGGDWANDRLIPDCVRSFLSGEKILIRFPGAIRPWQHVLDPLAGYLLLAVKMLERPREFSQAWNFGPDSSHSKSVEWIVQRLCARWQGKLFYGIESASQPHEASILKLDSTKARNLLGWWPRWDLNRSLEKIVEWTEAYSARENVAEICQRQIDEYENEKVFGD